MHTRTKTKGKKPAIKMLPGFVARVRVRCGKSNCRCTRGNRHIAHYHVTYLSGFRLRKYLRREQVREVQNACKAHRELQAEMRAGRAEYRKTLVQFRKLVKLLAGE